MRLPAFAVGVVLTAVIAALGSPSAHAQSPIKHMQAIR
jgi:hypothetical protein